MNFLVNSLLPTVAQGWLFFVESASMGRWRLEKFYPSSRISEGRHEIILSIPDCSRDQLGDALQHHPNW